MDVFQLQSTFMMVAFVAVLGVKLFAFVTSLTFPGEAYEAASKLTKPAWSAILGVGVVLQLLQANPLGLFNIILLVAALVFLADVRPALRNLLQR